jgi:hypothetical protein
MDIDRDIDIDIDIDIKEISESNIVKEYEAGAQLMTRVILSLGLIQGFR